ncbi:hypothetical protein CEXT_79641 [Caerostris extrusa]|uniref:Uncharacterized protein n=1 Tax=Caerostris extrusa TaxID=172846 RepID=A0AAV4UX36_CAEEX|nr:hypothetical protein CEXT_79641 [Caerostris extrusa]
MRRKGKRRSKVKKKDPSNVDRLVQKPSRVFLNVPQNDTLEPNPVIEAGVLTCFFWDKKYPHRLMAGVRLKR